DQLRCARELAQREKLHYVFCECVVVRLRWYCPHQRVQPTRLIDGPDRFTSMLSSPLQFVNAQATNDLPSPSRRCGHKVNGVVNSVSFVSTTNTARSLASFVSLALALTLWRSPGSSEKFCPSL